MAVFFAWSRESRSDGGLGWLESARRANFATLVSSHRDASVSSGVPAGTGSSGAAQRGTGQRRTAAASDTENVDDDEHLAAYNDYLARLNQSHER
jgi:DNA/RNA-binding domain of Phe-tRNA-synthetase-like protein